MLAKPIGVPGLGLLGRGIAACFLGRGFHVVGYTTGEHTFERADQYITTALGELVGNAGFPASLGTEWRQRFVAARSLADFSSCGFVIESVVEDAAMKRDVFDQFEAVLSQMFPSPATLQPFRSPRCKPTVKWCPKLDGRWTENNAWPSSRMCFAFGDIG